ncbi:MAG: hypothetical protein JST26_18425 [Bacteroidetes bacterium]|nr:hypothetical protein [Bacteroidota bacterium]
MSVKITNYTNAIFEIDPYFGNLSVANTDGCKYQTKCEVNSNLLHVSDRMIHAGTIAFPQNPFRHF